MSVLDLLLCEFAVRCAVLTQLLPLAGCSLDCDHPCRSSQRKFACRCVEESEQEVGCECGRQGRRGGGEKRDVERGKKRGKKAWERTQGPNIRLGKIWSETEEKFEKGGRGRRGKEGGNGKDENEVELPRTVVAMLRIVSPSCCPCRLLARFFLAPSLPPSLPFFLL